MPDLPDSFERPSSLREYRHATLTKSTMRHRADERLRHITGAAYRKGRLIPQSQRVGGLVGDFVVADDPEVVKADQPDPWRLHGRWLYGGHWMGQFGHFLTETVTTLWPTPSPKVDGLVFHRFIFGSGIQEWQTQFLIRTGWDLPVVVVHRRPCVVDRLVVPSRAFVANAYAAPEALQLWQRMAGHRPAVGRPLYLSRTQLAADHARRVIADEQLDDLMAGLGLDVVHPQQLPPAQQIDLVASAPVIVGVAGSQMHLSAFARPDTQVIEIGDARSPGKPLRNQLIIDERRGRPTDFVPFLAKPDGSRDTKATLEAVADLLK